MEKLLRATKPKEFVLRVNAAPRFTKLDWLWKSLLYLAEAASFKGLPTVVPLASALSDFPCISSSLTSFFRIGRRRVYIKHRSIYISKKAEKKEIRMEGKKERKK
jgi:hypothetical protein